MIDIKGYEGLYAADKSGKIWGYPKHRLKTGRFLKTWLIGNGYEMVMLYKDKKPRKFLVHRLIAQTFIPNSQNLREVNHKDGNRLNNRPENLEWVSSKQNKRHAWKTGLYLKPNKLHWNAKLDFEKVKEIRKLLANGELSQKKIGKLFGVSQAVIGSIHLRRSWVRS